MAKSINLTPRDKPKKKQDKYSEISDIKKEFKFPMKSKVIYVGMTTIYRGLEATVIKPSRRKNNDYYNIEFDDGEQLDSISSVYLRTLEEYELELEQSENKSEDDQSNIPEIEVEMIKNGIESHKNYQACLSPIVYSEMRCFECNYESRCVYHSKHNYKKLNLK